MYKNIILPASILAGTIIGAGIFSLPFVFNAAGMPAGLFYLLFFSVIYIFIYIFYADVMLRTSGEHRFVGYARIYFGNWGFWAALLFGLAQLFFVLTIYLILAPSFSGLFFPDDYLSQLLIFWFLGSAAILFDTKRVASLEFIIVAGIITIIFLIFGLGAKSVFFVNWSIIGDFSSRSLVLFGPVLFALSGSLAVPEVVSYFRESGISISFLKKSLILGSFLPAFIYAAFVVGILGLSPKVSEDAVSGLVGYAPSYILVFLGILGFLSLISSYIVAGLNARRVLQYDLNLSGRLSRFLVILIPLALYFLGFQNFLGLVTFVGAVFLPLESIFIIFMWLRADKGAEAPPILVGNFVRTSIPFLILVFLTGLIYVIIK
ncbi:MAG: hypothetical protein A3I89_04030 [Candidatus Harrisonbacteria bacterium RIFCSPLOWO2_02_FULL_41_11]|uniref:Amino acid transporter transmembrane domain-containing protein n=1 Tax=Candidatus Harrisonbacteria bacterium RIFCSPHIGHO2_02_FULL_42_16 TaxID=1798404 RepID=A0A1G1ZHT7_9BACT|nr:MAG: hypothetical protein A3B92_01085 [Candidatus Harrisonbacteria bacterium RIFCSPHIGHO2_02_FULL_42_16]OGY67150.1 MAG: hypothetical protein A3I89_04030 [Candidatus Harrisonbacteria bacterium RIFCSPLOWO2_02_FULL_41_11]